MNGFALRSRDITAMLLIGDGIAAILAPKARTLVWRSGPPKWRNIMGALTDHPAAAVAIGIAETAVGVWLIRKNADKLVEAYSPDKPDPIERLEAA